MSDVFYLSNSMLRDYESMCPIAFNKKWFGSDEEKEIFNIDHIQAVRFGVMFETLCIGSGLNGKTIEPTAKEKASVFYPRIKQQAKVCRDYLKAMDGRLVEAQNYLKGSFEYEGQTIYIQGNLDIRWEHSDGSGAVIDLKSTADATSVFGPYAWGRLENMDVSQLMQYKLLYYLNFGSWPDTYYLVFDLSTHERFLPIRVDISEWAIEEHKARVAKAYRSITESIMLDFWEPKPNFSECKKCPIRDVCKYARKFPEIEILQR